MVPASRIGRGDISWKDSAVIYGITTTFVNTCNIMALGTPQLASLSILLYLDVLRTTQLNDSLIDHTTVDNVWFYENDRGSFYFGTNDIVFNFFLPSEASHWDA